MTFWGRTCRVGCVRRVKHWLNIKASKINGRICQVDPHLFCFPGGAGSSSGEGEGLAPARCCGGQQLFCVWDVQTISVGQVMQLLVRKRFGNQWNQKLKQTHTLVLQPKHLLSQSATCQEARRAAEVGQPSNGTPLTCGRDVSKTWVPSSTKMRTRSWIFKLRNSRFNKPFQTLDDLILIFLLISYLSLSLFYILLVIQFCIEREGSCPVLPDSQGRTWCSLPRQRSCGGLWGLWPELRLFRAWELYKGETRFGWQELGVQMFSSFFITVFL